MVRIRRYMRRRVRAYRRNSAALCPRQSKEAVQTNLRFKSWEELEAIGFADMQTFVPLLVTIGSEIYVLYVEEWEGICITSEALEEAKKECGDDEDCTDDYLMDWVDGKADQIVKEEGWDGYIRAYESAPYGETIFYRRLR